MHLELTQKTSQQLLMTLQLKQAIKILSMGVQELSEEIQNQLNDNPVLEIPEEKERVVEVDPKSIFEDTNIWFDDGEDDEEKDLFNFLSSEIISLDEQLREQLNFNDLSGEQERIFTALLSNINESGFLICGTLEIAYQLQCKETEVVEVLNLIHSLEPAGIAARSLSECLCLQLNTLGCKNIFAYQIAENYLELLAKRKYRTMAEALSCSVSEVQEAIKIIQHLKPAPLYGSNLETAKILVPDLRIIQSGNNWQVLLNDDNLPDLAISEHYLYLINNNIYDSKAEQQFLSKKFKEAGWFLQAIFQRNATMKKVAECIFHLQDKFLKYGSSHLKPLTLREVAELAGVHESTVSRAVNEKYIETPRGIYPLKFFFTSKAKNNSNASAVQVKHSIKTLIAAENASEPLSDQEICEKLRETSLRIARRTVAKYREALKIPSARMRKKL